MMWRMRPTWNGEATTACVSRAGSPAGVAYRQGSRGRGRIDLPMTAADRGASEASRLRDDVVLDALYLVVASGVVPRKEREGLQTSCLGLCNLLREQIPQKVLFDSLTVSSLVEGFFPEAFDGDLVWGRVVSRVEPPRRLVSIAIYWDPEVIGVGPIRWPRGLREVKLGDMCDFMFVSAESPLPESVERVALYMAKCPHLGCDHRVEALPRDISWPHGLRELYLGEAFNFPMRDVIWPPGLEVLSIPGQWGPLQGTRWPPRLHTLDFFSRPREFHRKRGMFAAELSDDSFSWSFGGGFNEPISGPGTLPPGLRRLWLGEYFRRDLTQVDWPKQLEEIAVGVSFVVPFDVQWPPTLKRLYVSKLESVERWNLPRGCEAVELYDKVDREFCSGGGSYENVIEMDFELDGIDLAHEEFFEEEDEDGGEYNDANSDSDSFVL